MGTVRGSSLFPMVWSLTVRGSSLFPMVWSLTSFLETIDSSVILTFCTDLLI